MQNYGHNMLKEHVMLRYPKKLRNVCPVTKLLKASAQKLDFFCKICNRPTIPNTERMMMKFLGRGYQNYAGLIIAKWHSVNKVNSRELVG
jgi:hypothetical protein